jgi:2-aminoethylphosphonate-pyruvate transaminase
VQAKNRPFERSFDLLCPGPVNVHPQIASALTSFEFGHREEELSWLLDDMRRNFLAVAGVDSDRYTAVFLTGSGTSANESVLATAVAEDDTVLVIHNGEFGERLARISRIYNERTVCVRHDWGERIDLERVAEALSQHDVDVVVMVHHETSTGMLNPVEEVGRLAHEKGARFVVDAVSSFSADTLDIERAHVTFLTTSSGKAIGSYPGLAIVLGSHDAFRRLGSRSPRCHYLDLYRYYEFAENNVQTPNTPALPLMLALNRSLEMILAEGMPARLERLARLAAHVRRRARDHDLEVVVKSEPRSSVLTSILLPDDLPFEQFRQALREHGFVIYGGKGPYEDRMFQVSTIGAIDIGLIDDFFTALADVFFALRRAQRARRSAVA